VRHLKSGTLLLIMHGPLDINIRQEKLTAVVSEEDGLLWQGGLVLDEREDVTYPDGIEGENGTIYIVYDHNRTPEGNVVMAVICERDALAGKMVTN